MQLSVGKKIIFSLIAVILFIGLLESGLRGVLFFTSFAKKGLDLDPYEEPDPQFGWRLKANYLKSRFSPDTNKEEVLKINSKGFRGKEFNKDKTTGVIRIITMGDSVTFGITPESCPYPAQLQKLFIGKYSNKIEVINAGVEGYSSEYVLKRLEYDILQYKPDIVTVYVGWNDLYAINPLSPWQYKKFSGLAKFLNNFYLYKAFRRVIFLGIKPKIEQRFMNNNYNQRIEDIYQNFEPIIYKENLRKIIEIARANQIKLVFINLASILSNKMTSSDTKKVHYPYFTSDIEKLKTLQNRYNKVIENIAQEEKVPLIDLDKAINQVADKGILFFDTMHPYCEGQKIIAKIIFNNLISQKLLNLVK